MGRRDRRSLAQKILIAVVAGVLIVGISLPMILSLLPERATVPDLVGKGLRDAGAEARRSGLSLKVTAAVPAELERDRVVSQRPAAGERVSAGTVIEVEVSR